MMKFNEILKSFRKQSNMTQVQLAEKLNVAQGTIANWERGMREPDIETIKRIAEVLCIPAERLFSDGSETTANKSYPTNATPAATSERRPVQFWGGVAAGVGAYAEGVAVRTMPANDEDMIDGYDYAWLEVEGDSMYPDLQDGDYVLVRVQDTAENGDLIVALIDDGCERLGVVKRLELVEGHHLSLISTNPTYPPRVFVGEQMNDVHIFGIVVSSQRKWH